MFEGSQEVMLNLKGCLGFCSYFKHQCGECTATMWEAGFEGGQRGPPHLGP